MKDFKPYEIPKDLNHHVYILFSPTKKIIKVGRSNGSARIKALKKMHYGDVPDWECYQIIKLNSRHAAVAVEAMAHARFIDEGIRIDRFEWTRLPDNKQCFAEECFKCDPEHAKNVVEEMATIYEQYVSKKT